MAISPITNVIFGSRKTNNIEQNRKEKPKNTIGMSTPLRAIPLAVLLAMSPLNTVQAQNNSSDKEKIIATGTFKNACADFHASDPNGTCEIFFISTDKNDEDAEVIRLRFLYKSNDRLDINGKKTKMSVNYTTDINVETLVVCNETRTYKNRSPIKSNSYYVEGPIDYYRSNYFNDKGDVIEKDSFHKKTKGEIKITKEFYDYLKETMGDCVKYKTKSETINGDLETKMIIDGHVF